MDATSDPGHESQDHVPGKPEVLCVSRGGRRVHLVAEKVISRLVIPCYPETSSSDEQGVLTMVPASSLALGTSAKAFIAYKCRGGECRNLGVMPSPYFGFGDFEWSAYACGGVDACPHVPRAVLERSHTALAPGDSDAYAEYERIFLASSGVSSSAASAKAVALSKEWDFYVSSILPFVDRECPNALCSRMSTPPGGCVRSSRATRAKFLGCKGYTAGNAVGHKYRTLGAVTSTENYERWLNEKRYAGLSHCWLFHLLSSFGSVCCSCSFVCGLSLTFFLVSALLARIVPGILAGLHTTHQTDSLRCGRACQCALSARGPSAACTWGPQFPCRRGWGVSA